MPGVTVGLPVGDGLHEFELAVRSVFAQTYSDWELIVICDGSPDSIVKRAQQIEDERVRIVVHPENRGLAYRLNEIARLATAKYIARMDADDIMHPCRLSKSLDFLRLNPGVDVVGSGSYLINANNGVEGAYREPDLPKKLSGYLNSGVFSHPTVTFKTVWALSNPYDPTRIRTEDKELWLRAAGTSSYSKMDNRLLFCRVPQDLSVTKQQLTAKYDRQLLRELGPKVASKPRIWMKVIESLVKQKVFSFAHRGGFLSFVYRTKFSRLSEREFVESAEMVELVTNTEVPGWEHNLA
jgi:glycosyltransferase involved in cell wall biosynthesis